MVDIVASVIALQNTRLLIVEVPVSGHVSPSIIGTIVMPVGTSMIR